MSDTPRTDAAVRREADGWGVNPDRTALADLARILEREVSALQREVAITRQVRHDLSIAFKTGNPSATELHYAQYAIADLRERAMRAEEERDHWKRQAIGATIKQPKT